MVVLTLPDGSACHFEAGVTGSEIAATISRSLLKKAVAVEVDGRLCDLTDPITQNATIRVVTRDDKEALELIRHDAAHVMAEAVQALYPDTLVAIGPVIENGFYYDFFREEPFTTADLARIEAKMREIIKRNRPFVKEVWSRDRARSVFLERGERFKVELIDSIPSEQELRVYSQGDWFDLCRGPHMSSTSKIGTAFKLMRVAGAYWRGNSEKPMLTRIYGTAWANEQDLHAYMKRIEEAEKRDHRRLGRELDFFHLQEDGPGVVFWHARGWTMFQELLAYMRRQLAGVYEEVNSPQILDKSLWDKSGHWNWFRENMFASRPADTESAGKERLYVLKPMNCPGHIGIFMNRLKSYRDLPVRLAEFGVVHRYEPSGALHGLMRVRGFTQDDAHVFCREDQLAEECLRINDLVLRIYADFGFREDILVKLSTRPKERVGSDSAWDHAESVMKIVLERIESDSGGRVKTGINQGEGAFYGPKFEYTLHDAIGREWQCGTTQVDFNLPGRFGASFVDRDGGKKTPVMIHRAICGSLERFLGILIEHYAGRMPLWLSPVQVVVATITSDSDDYARDVSERLRRFGLRCEVDLRNEKINYKIREHSLAKVPAIFVCGPREREERTVTVRRLGSQEQKILPLSVAADALRQEATPPDLLREVGEGST